MLLQRGGHFKTFTRQLGAGWGACLNPRWECHDVSFTSAPGTCVVAFLSPWSVKALNMPAMHTASYHFPKRKVQMEMVAARGKKTSKNLLIERHPERMLKNQVIIDRNTTHTVLVIIPV